MLQGYSGLRWLNRRFREMAMPSLARLAVLSHALRLRAHRASTLAAFDIIDDDIFLRWFFATDHGLGVDAAAAGSARPRHHRPVTAIITALSAFSPPAHALPWR